MVALRPEATPVTIPVDAPIVAMVGDEDVQVPPEFALFNVIVCPAHTTEGPVITARGLTVIGAVAIQPLAVV